jgi:hypothetical protein
VWNGIDFDVLVIFEFFSLGYLMWGCEVEFNLTVCVPLFLTVSKKTKKTKETEKSNWKDIRSNRFKNHNAQRAHIRSAHTPTPWKTTQR